MSRFRWCCFALIILKCHLSAAKDITGEASQGLFGLQFLCHTLSNIRNGRFLDGAGGEFKFQISGGGGLQINFRKLSVKQVTESIQFGFLYVLSVPRFASFCRLPFGVISHLPGNLRNLFRVEVRPKFLMPFH